MCSSLFFYIYLFTNLFYSYLFIIITIFNRFSIVDGAVRALVKIQIGMTDEGPKAAIRPVRTFGG